MLRLAMEDLTVGTGGNSVNLLVLEQYQELQPLVSVKRLEQLEVWVSAVKLRGLIFMVLLME